METLSPLDATAPTLQDTPAVQSAPLWRRPRTYVGALVLLVVLGLLSRALAPKPTVTTTVSTPPVRLLTASDYVSQTSDLFATGDVHGRAEATLRSEYSTPILSVLVELGQTVEAGQPLVVFTQDDLQAQLAQAQASVERATATLALQEAGARDEERERARQAVALATANLDAARAALFSTQTSVQSTLEGSYQTALATSESSFSAALNAVLAVADLQESYLNCNEQSCYRVAQEKALAIEPLLGVSGAGRFNRSSLLAEQGGVRTDLATLSTGELNPQTLHTVLADLDDSLHHARLMLLEARSAMEDGAAAGHVSDTDRTTVTTQLTYVTTALSSLTASAQTVRSAEAGVLAREATTLAVIRYADHPSLRSANASVAAAEASLATAQQTLTQMEAGARDLDLAPTRAAVLEAQSAYHVLLARQRQAIVTAPFAGTVATLPARAGELVAPGQPLLSLVNTDLREVWTAVPAQDAVRLHVGQSAVIDGAYTGIVSSLAPAVDPATGKVEVRVALEAGAPFVPGSFVSLALNAAAPLEQPSYAIPLSAVRMTAEGAFIYTLDENQQVVPQAITIGTLLDDQVTVVDGLEASTQFLSSVQGLSAGDMVQPQ